MKLIGFITILFVAGIANANHLDGTYVGKGSYKTKDGQKGTYSVEVTIKGHKSTSKYAFTKDKGFTFSAEAKFDKNGFITVEAGKAKGEGYCFEVWCHYELPSETLEETVVFKGKNLYRLGSKMENKVLIAWEEMLTKK